MVAAVKVPWREKGMPGSVHLEEDGSKKRTDSSRRRRAVTVLDGFSSQLRAKTGISAVWELSCVTFSAKTATAQ